MRRYLSSRAKPSFTEAITRIAVTEGRIKSNAAGAGCLLNARVDTAGGFRPACVYKSTITAAASTGGVPPWWIQHTGPVGLDGGRHPRGVHRVAGEALRLAEPRALANQQDHHLRAEDLAPI